MNRVLVAAVFGYWRSSSWPCLLTHKTLAFVVEARVGFEPLSAVDTTQLTHSITRQKRQNGQISGIEVPRRYTGKSSTFWRTSILVVFRGQDKLYGWFEFRVQTDLVVFVPN